MGELQKYRAARSQENRGLPIDRPGDRPRTEYARERAGRHTAYQVQLALQAFRADDFERVMLGSRVHSCRLDIQLCRNREGASMSRYGAAMPALQRARKDARRSGVGCEAREGTRIIRIRRSQAHLF